MLQNQFDSFDRHFFDSLSDFTTIGNGAMGGKAANLAVMKKILTDRIDANKYPGISIEIPKTTVIRTGVFERFMELNDLYGLALSEASDEKIKREFLKAELPPEIVGDLRSFVSGVHLPLAVRSSSKLEDDKDKPFAGVYATKMIANNQIETGTRFHSFTEAIKFIYASTFFAEAKDYRKAAGIPDDLEKMAVIIQEVIGSSFNDRFYPVISGVAKSFNYYPQHKMKAEDGVVNLALGLGKTIVDGGICWTYSPRYPRSAAPFAGAKGLLKNTQANFFAVSLSKLPNYDPLKEDEYLIKADLGDAEYDGTLRLIASTYDPAGDRITMGTGNDGPRVINFSPLLQLNEFKFNTIVSDLLSICEEVFEEPVEIEFAVELPAGKKKPRFGFLQVRPMYISTEKVTVTNEELNSPATIVASGNALGNSTVEGIKDIVYVKPETFDKKNTVHIPAELEKLNRQLIAENRPYLLIGFGRWGSSDHWLGIPVQWGQICGAKIIVEATLPDMNVELSQGSHFFHNLVSFRVGYLSVHHETGKPIAWEKLEGLSAENETDYIRHVRLKDPLRIKIDGRESKGVIML